MTELATALEVCFKAVPRNGVFKWRIFALLANNKPLLTRWRGILPGILLTTMKKVQPYDACEAVQSSRMEIFTRVFGFFGPLPRDCGDGILLGPSDTGIPKFQRQGKCDDWSAVVGIEVCGCESRLCGQDSEAWEDWLGKVPDHNASGLGLFHPESNAKRGHHRFQASRRDNDRFIGSYFDSFMAQIMQHKPRIRPVTWSSW
jgi:hypothetical protein